MTARGPPLLHVAHARIDFDGALGRFRQRLQQRADESLSDAELRARAHRAFDEDAHAGRSFGHLPDDATVPTRCSSSTPARHSRSSAAAASPYDRPRGAVDGLDGDGRSRERGHCLGSTTASRNGITEAQRARGCLRKSAMVTVSPVVDPGPIEKRQNRAARPAGTRRSRTVGRSTDKAVYPFLLMPYGDRRASLL